MSQCASFQVDFLNDMYIHVYIHGYIYIYIYIYDIVHLKVNNKATVTNNSGVVFGVKTTV